MMYKIEIIMVLKYIVSKFPLFLLAESFFSNLSHFKIGHLNILSFLLLKSSNAFEKQFFIILNEFLIHSQAKKGVKMSFLFFQKVLIIRCYFDN